MGGLLGRGRGRGKGRGRGRGRGRVHQPILESKFAAVDLLVVIFESGNKVGEDSCGEGGKGVLRESLEGVMRVWTICGGGGAQDA